MPEEHHEPATLRSHLEAIRDACTPDEPGQYEPPRAVLCREHAVAALATLDNAHRLDLYYGSPEARTWAVVADPGPDAGGVE